MATKGVTVADLISNALRRYGNRTCLMASDETWTYSDFARHVSAYRRRLHQSGLRRRDGVAMLSVNRPEVLVAMVAALVAGYRYTPLHPLASVDDQAFILDDAEIGVLLYGPEQEERAAALVDRSKIREAIQIEPADKVSQGLQAPLLNDMPESEDELAWLVYTGGTTGRPKGVMLSHRVMVQNILMTLAEWDWPPDIRFLAVTPLSHSAGVIALAVLVKGGTVCILGKPEPGLILSAVAKHQITATFLVPSLIYRLLDEPASATADTHSLELVIYGASPIAPARLQDAIQRFGPVFMQLYGQTEAPNTATILRKHEHDPSQPNRLLSCGHAVPGIRLQIQDDLGREVQAGEVGEICIQGRLVMDGYWKLADATAETLRGGWLHTGDLGRQDEEGFVYIVDRSKDMVVSGGFNVYPREVEDVLMTHPLVRAAAVIGVPDEGWGEAVKAIVVATGSVSAEELIALVRERKGPVYAPKSVDFVTEIPLTAVGKPDKKVLRARYWRGQERLVH